MSKNQASKSRLGKIGHGAVNLLGNAVDKKAGKITTGTSNKKGNSQSQEKISKESTQKTKKANEETDNPPSKKKKNTVKFTQETLISDLKKILDEKYDLEQEMARLTGGETGVVELKAQIASMWRTGNLDGAKMYERMFQRKATAIKDAYKKIQDKQKRAANRKQQREKQKKAITPNEAELYHLISYIQYEDFYKELIEENEKFMRETKRKREEKKGDEKSDN